MDLFYTVKLASASIAADFIVAVEVTAFLAIFSQFTILNPEKVKIRWDSHEHGVVSTVPGQYFCPRKDRSWVIFQVKFCPTWFVHNFSHSLILLQWLVLWIGYSHFIQILKP